MTTPGEKSVEVQLAELRGAIDGLDRLTDAKFVTFRALVDSQAEKVALALASADKAVSKAETANERRFDSVNEFRKTLTDQAQTFLSRVEFDALSSTLSARLNDISSRLDKAEGASTGLGQGWTYLVGFVGLVVAVITIIGIIVGTR